MIHDINDKYELYQMVKIVWIDASTNRGWRLLSDDELMASPHLCKSVGYIVDYVCGDGGFVTLSQTLAWFQQNDSGPPKNSQHHMCIPQCCVQSITPLVREPNA